MCPFKIIFTLAGHVLLYFILHKTLSIRYAVSYERRFYLFSSNGDEVRAIVANVFVTANILICSRTSNLVNPYWH